MQLLTPAFGKLVEAAKDKRTYTEMSEQCMQKLSPFLTVLRNGEDPLVSLDIVATTMVTFAVKQIAELEQQYCQKTSREVPPLPDIIEQLLVLKLMALYKAMLDPDNKREHPYCCEAHLIQAVLLQMLVPIYPQHAVQLLTEALAIKLMQDIDHKNLSKIDKLVDDAATTLRRKCYQLVYGDEGGKAADEAQAERH